MKCHWAVEDGIKYWIPGCMQAINCLYEDGSCPCRKSDKKQKVKPNNDKSEIEYLLKENANLNRIIEKLK